MNQRPPERRCLIVEDLPAVRQALRQVVMQAFPEAHVDAAHDLKSARALLTMEPAYDLVMLDLGLPDGSGIDLIPDVRSGSAQTQVVVTTIFDDDDHIFRAIAAGADGYLLKEQPPEVLVQHLIRLEQGAPALSPSVARKILAYFASVPQLRSPPKSRPQGARLTERETEVLSLIGRGLQRAEVGEILHISENTVAKYVKEIYRKLDISSRAEAALEAQRRGLV